MTFTIDLHCHPAQRPFAKSFSSEQPGVNDTNPKRRPSIWYYDPPSAGDRLLNRVTGLTKFSQSNMTALSYGNVRCVFASLYPIERGFFRMTTGTGLFTDFMANMVSSLGKSRVDYLQGPRDYFRELEEEYDFFLQLDGKIVKLKEGEKRYLLVKNIHAMEEHMQLHAGSDVETIYVVLSIEGMHVLGTGLDEAADEEKVLANVRKLKSWNHCPFFVTFAHHFYNEMSGHAESLTGFPSDLLTSQEYGFDFDIQPLGWKVIAALLDETNGRRIHIDLKHMNGKSRDSYIKWLKEVHAAAYKKQEIPLIVSHGACNGMRSIHDSSATPGLQLTASRMYAEEINFYDEEILEIKKSGGVIGLQLDERRIASKQYMRSLRLELSSKTRRMHSNSKMLWNNIEHIVRLLDTNDMYAWDCIAIGSDFDGLVDPINLFWTAEEMDDLVQYIERHAYDFLKEPGNLKNSFNKITALEAVERVFHYNVYEFMRKYFH